MKLIVRATVSVVLMVAFLWLAFRNVDFQAMLAYARQADHRYTLLAFASLSFMQFCRIVRWELLLRHFVSVSFKDVFRIGSVGLMLIMLLPLRLGEFARPLLLKRDCKASLSSGLATIVVERVIDGLLVTLLFFATLEMVDDQYTVPAGLHAAAYAALALFASVGTAVVLGLLWGESFSKLVRRMGHPISPRLTERALSMLQSFVHGLRALQNGREILQFTAWTLCYWASNGLAMYFVMLGFGWTHLPMMAGFTLVSVIVIGIMIPAGPGFLGTFQAAVALGLSIFGVGTTEAAAYGLVIYPVTLLVALLFGMPFFVGGHLHLKEAIRPSTSLDPSAPPEAS